ELIESRDGLILGICNGFQALIKLGLLPFGKISQATENSPTLTHNSIGRHQAMYVQTRVSSVNSPWLSKCTVGEIYAQPISHGEGRFAANTETLETLKSNGQIIFQYLENPNGSDWNIEGICSPDGRVLGKMAHTERVGENVAKNIYGNKHMPLFEAGVGYFE
ncbi:MAG: phosphoribosylformylglycinamidine synthase subunit PurQ, partial [Oscillospiraceae bacterium]|nr:phosphoribosylformylglycinamidine synthase subunit PurQ [Oscillospiraceae bacterium]